jgi:hypothetical protein
MGSVITKSGLFIHHLFWGIWLLMPTGFAALACATSGGTCGSPSCTASNSALTLDEFALWLRLADVYWTPQAIESLKVSAAVAALLALYGFAPPF